PPHSATPPSQQAFAYRPLRRAVPDFRGSTLDFRLHRSSGRSTTKAIPSLHLRARRDVRRQLDRGVLALPSTRVEDHAVRREALAELARRKVRHHDDDLADELAGVGVALRDAADDGARLALAEIDRQLEQLVLLRHLLGREHLSGAQVDGGKLVDGERRRGWRRGLGFPRPGFRLWLCQHELAGELGDVLVLDAPDERARLVDARLFERLPVAPFQRPAGLLLDAAGEP